MEKLTKKQEIERIWTKVKNKVFFSCLSDYDMDCILIDEGIKRGMEIANKK